MNPSQTLLLIVMISIGLFACGGSNANRSIVPGPETTIIPINPEHVDESNHQHFLDTIIYVKLNTPPKHRVGTVDKIITVGDKWYFLDVFNSASFFCFDTTGNFIFELNSIGKGPEEYIEPWDIIYNPFFHALELYNRPGQKIIRYSLDGTFLKEWILP